MRKLRRFIAAVVLVSALPAGPAIAAAPEASCPGQELSALGPVLGPVLGAFIAFEAQNPELEGRKSFGEEVSEFAQADRGDCPEE